MSLLEVSGISKNGTGGFALRDISFSLAEGQKIAIAGATGSGKSTLLRIIAGLVQPDSGNVWFRQARVAGPGEQLIPGHPGIAYLSQHFELRNNYRVEEILAYANKGTEEEAQALYSICRIAHLLKRKTDQLSGGERQRIALARLLVGAPQLLLLDEPYSNLDMMHKQVLKTVIRELGERKNITCMLVAHEPADLLSWADEIFVVKEGRLVQRGSPEQVYRQPVDRYTAALFGPYQLMPPALAAACTGQPVKDDKSLLLRPQDLRLVAEGHSALRGVVRAIHFLGSGYATLVTVGSCELTIHSRLNDCTVGDTVHVSCSPTAAWYLPHAGKDPFSATDLGI